MARSEARIGVDIWSDADFRSLSPPAQWLYMFLLSQPDLSHLGVLPLRERRWTRYARGLTEDALADGLRELSDALYVIIDRDTDELFVRSLVRRDGIFKQPNIFRAAEKQLPLVESPAIRVHLAIELLRIMDTEDVPKLSVPIMDRLLADLPNPSANPPSNPSGVPSGDPSPDPSPASLGVRGVVTAVSSEFPLPLSPEPPSPAPAAREREPEPTESATAQTIIGEYVDRCRKRPPKQVIGQISKIVKAMLGEGIDPDDIRRGIAHWMTKDLHPSTLPSIVNAVMNGGARASPGTALALPGGQHRPSTTDQRVAAALALADQFEAMEEP